jgi:hypothetical protein
MNKFTKILLFIGFLGAVAIVLISLSKEQQKIVVVSGNTDAKPLEIKLGHVLDGDCGMVIDSLEYTSQVVNKEGKTWFFHDHGGMAKWLENKEFKEGAVIWVWAKDSKKWIDGRKAWYSKRDTTPMNYGFGAYENEQPEFIRFDEMTLKMQRGENLTNPYVRKQLGMSH